MESIASLFHSIRQDNPNYGDFICLIKAVEGTGIKRKSCEFYLTELVTRKDYSKSDLDGLLDTLVESAKTT